MKSIKYLNGTLIIINLILTIIYGILTLKYTKLYMRMIHLNYDKLNQSTQKWLLIILVILTCFAFILQLLNLIYGYIYRKYQYIRIYSWCYAFGAGWNMIVSLIEPIYWFTVFWFVLTTLITAYYGELLIHYSMLKTVHNEKRRLIPMETITNKTNSNENNYLTV
ncbi:hypothetical protein BLOT_014545 [Blomia tropicalis]|nr:hypothetical protein BLOT_014545 [Blomia tropicalis]